MYSLDPVEFKILKTYLKINFANGFIWSLETSVSAFIFFVQKFDSSLGLCINYRGFNNPTIKN